MFRFERALLANADIIGLLRAQFGQFRTQLAKVQTGNFFVQMLWQHIDLAFVIIAVLPQFDLRQHLIGERRAHHKAGVARGTTQIQKPALGQQNNPLAIGKLCLLYTSDAADD